MAKKYRVQLFLTQAHYIAIGRAIAIWAALEIKFDEHLLRMLRHDNAKTIRTRQNINHLDHIPKALKKRLDLFDELAKAIYQGKPLSEFLCASKRCLTLSKDRHRLAHGEWLIECLPRSTKLTSRMRRAGRAGKGRIFSVPQIREMTHEVCNLYADLDKLTIAYPPAHLAKELKEFARALQRKPTP